MDEGDGLARKSDTPYISTATPLMLTSVSRL